MSISIGQNKTSFPLTTAILPTWRNYQDLTTTQKVAKIFVDTLKTLLWIIPVIPLATAVIDFFSKKTVVPVKAPSTEETTPEKRSLLSKAGALFEIITQSTFLIFGTALTLQGAGILGTLHIPLTSYYIPQNRFSTLTGINLVTSSLNFLIKNSPIKRYL